MLQLSMTIKLDGKNDDGMHEVKELTSFYSAIKDDGTTAMQKKMKMVWKG
jgi:hypothetical protein